MKTVKPIVHSINICSIPLGHTCIKPSIDHDRKKKEIHVQSVSQPQENYCGYTALISFPFEPKAYYKLEHKKKLTEQKYEGNLKLLHENHYLLTCMLHDGININSFQIKSLQENTAIKKYALCFTALRKLQLIKS